MRRSATQAGRPRPGAGPPVVPGWERALAVAMLCYFVVDIAVLLRMQGELPQGPAASNATASIFQNGVFGLTFLLLLRAPRATLDAVRRGWAAWSVVALAVLSVAWSVAPGLTFRRAYALGASTLFGAYLASRYPIREQLSLLRWSALLILAGSALLAAGLPQWGVHQDLHRGAWMGLFIHKNALGRFAALGLLCFLLTASSPYRFRSLSWLGVVIAVLCMLLSTSKSALVLSILILAIPVWGRILRLPALPAIGYSILLVIGGAALGGVAVTSMEAILEQLGRDATFTGRTEIWPVALAAAVRRFWLGYGYNVFWGVRASGVGMVWRVAGWEAVHAHNGLLEIWLDIGMLGVLITLIGFVAMLLRAIRVAHLGRYAASVWPLGLLVFLVAANVGEAPFLAHKNIYWVLYAATATSLWYQPRAGGGRRQPAPRGRLPGRAAAPVGDVRARPG